MKTPVILFVYLSCFTFNVSAQECDCLSNYNWMRKTFEENDAGFHYVIEQKGMDAYNAFNTSIEKRIMAQDTLSECYIILNDWLHFFRPAHLAIIPNETTQSSNQPSTVTSNPAKKETFKIKTDKFETYLKEKQTVDFEGIWKLDQYTFGIKKKDNDYIGFIIESTIPEWVQGDVKFKIHSNDSATYYLRNRSIKTIDKIELIGQNHLILGAYVLKRLSPSLPAEPMLDSYFKSISSPNPFIDKLNETTIFFRIPTFEGNQKPLIDSVILANKALLNSTENLIIDLRNNGGGSDYSYKEIIPLLYTNPIREVGMEYLSTPLNNKRIEDAINSEEFKSADEETKNWILKTYEILKAHPGAFVNPEDTDVTVYTEQQIHQYPENVAILINEGNGSSAEQFLLAAKQSKKVKLFGVTTMGVLDISNMIFVASPCNDFQLGYAISKSLRIPEMTIDGKGIQPDYYLDESIPQHQWIEFASGVLNLD